MHDHGGPAGGPDPFGAELIGTVLPVLVLFGLLAGYLVAVRVAGRRGRPWPWWRTAAWGAGLACAALAVLRPPGAGFVAHMAGHLLLGMLAPLLMVLGAPVTVLLRALPVRRARRLSRVLSGAPVRVLTHPVTAAVLNGGGLWLLYTTGLYEASGSHPAVHAAVHVHVFAAGYLFTAAVLGVDPAPHLPGHATRAAVLVIFLAAHGILAKHLYGHPPAGIAAGEAQAGAMLMYYGGDLIDLVLIVLLCRRWYAATRPRPGEPSAQMAGQRPFVTEKPCATHTFG